VPLPLAQRFCRRKHCIKQLNCSVPSERTTTETRRSPYLSGAAQTGGAAASHIDALIAQHNRRREITDYILAVTAKGAIPTRDAKNLAGVFDTLDLMYENHTAREDTIIFPAWNEALSKSQLDEIGDMFEEIERQTFGKDGFDDAVAAIGRIEQTLGFANIARFTALLPPKA
jgi:hypothetical protein